MPCTARVWAAALCLKPLIARLAPFKDRLPLHRILSRDKDAPILERVRDKPTVLFQGTTKVRSAAAAAAAARSYSRCLGGQRSGCLRGHDRREYLLGHDRLDLTCHRSRRFGVDRPHQRIEAIGIGNLSTTRRRRRRIIIMLLLLAAAELEGRLTLKETDALFLAVHVKAEPPSRSAERC